MKNVLLFVLLFTVLSSCKNSIPPKDVAKDFIQAVYTGDASKASELATENSRSTIGNMKAEMPGISAEESFSLTALTETISGNTAEVKNDLVRLSLEKEGETWKVVSTPELFTSITSRYQELAALKNKWEALQKEYEGRLRLATEYVKYKKSQGALSAQMQTLEEMINTLSVKTVWDKEKILLYVQRQGQLADMIDKSIEPSYTANADISMNYILQLSNANDRIKSAQGEYQALAEKTPSATYPTLAKK